MGQTGVQERGGQRRERMREESLSSRENASVEAGVDGLRSEEANYWGSRG